jgi:hypothetical protein
VVLQIKQLMTFQVSNVDYSLVLSAEATNINFIIFDLTRPGLETTFYRFANQTINDFSGQ